MYEFGRNLGIAFQLQDDYLDVYGDSKVFGKQVGGDIIENKKTFLVLKAMELGTATQKKALGHLYSIQPNDTTAKIGSIKEIFSESGAGERTKQEIKKYTQKALDGLESLKISEEKKELLKEFGSSLMKREV